ncbi:MAG TPA: 2-oxoglutarate and iron-dependent oxygenase domain-containing protein [Xanthobacteraceae bacterium]|jgi:isopenicillin N synthase-like dioxygenase|nr:2-oxoglutarate and iron-dependent oxygenase domain-containing protein [Xanthobacteraceae bacterium]
MLDIIDLAGLGTGDLKTVRRVAAAVGHACRETGFFYIRNHGVPAGLMTDVFARAADFFAEPAADKSEFAITRSRHNRGYVGVASESLNLAQADQKEAFNIGLDLMPEDAEVLAGKPFRGVNLWPRTPGFRDTALDYFNAMWRLALDLHLAIATDLGLPPTFFADKFDRPMATLRLLHYPPRGEVQDELPGAGEHTDYGSLTILLTDEVGGLEVRRRDGTWIEAPPIPGAFVCNIGDCLMRWSNDVYVSTPHRVKSPPGRDRYSIAYFFDPNPEALIECLPGCAAMGEAPKYPPIMAADYLRQRLVATYGS